MNHTFRTEHVHTFADVPRLTINRWQVTSHDNWDTEDRTTVQLGCEFGAVPNAVVDFLAQLHGHPYRTKEDIELLQRFAGAMGLDYPHEPGLSE
jgi:hypothetical protein